MLFFYLGFIMFVIGVILTTIINRNVEVPIDGDFFDMPIRVIIGILFIVVGGVIACISIFAILIIDPTSILMNKN